MGKRNLITGPWVGEFGWELMGWHSYLRGLSNHYDIICLGPESSMFFYLDFCKKYIPVERNEIYENYGSIDMYKCQNITFEMMKKIVFKMLSKDLIKDSIWLPPNNLVRTKGSHYHHFTEVLNFQNKSIKPLYKIFGNKTTANKKNYYVFHARNRQDVRPEDNWSYDKWLFLKEKIMKKQSDAKIYSIGKKNSAMWIEGTEDFRNKNLEEVCNILINSQAVFGPSSGAMHLASQCNATTVVWSKENNKNRYCEWWNPHNTPTLFLGKYKWHPPADYVFNQFNNWNKKDIISDI